MKAPATLLSAVPVPFEANGDLDEKGQETLLRHLKDIGIPGVFVSGTTGSSPRWTTTNELPFCVPR